MSAASVAAAVADAHRREWAFVLAATVRLTGDIDFAEECVQDAYAQALNTWATHGVPDRPGAWLTTVARRTALNLLKRAAAERRALPRLVEDRTEPGPEQIIADGRDEIPDDRLRLIFTCCHPTLAQPAQVALSLRLLCGLSTGEVARAFLVSEATMAARITRAKRKITAAGIPYQVPAAGELPERVDAVLEVVYLLYTTGHTAPTGADLTRRDLVERALDLARTLHTLLPTVLRPDDAAAADVAGLLALILLTDVRAATRVDSEGRAVLLADAERTQWDRTAIGEGIALVRHALRRRPPGRYALMAAIAAVHDEAPTWADTDWADIVTLYDLLVAIWPSPVVALNRAVAIGYAHGPAAGLTALDALSTEPQLAGYNYLAASRAELLHRLGRITEARLAYQEALLLTESTVERDFLATRLNQLPG